MNEEQLLLKVENLKKYFPIRKGIFQRVVGNVKAVDDVSFYIRKGEALGLVGESGCGKSTTGRCVIQLLPPTDGSVKYRSDGELVDLVTLKGQERKRQQRNIQMIFQDPFSSLDPRMSVHDIISEPMRVQKIGTPDERSDRVRDLLVRVGLRSYQMNRYPHEFSGGQRQRIGVARALALNPELIICDEPVSALDVSVQAQVLNLLADLRQEFNLTYLFIAHDLSVVEHVSDRVMVMYLGKIVEIASSNELYNSPKHPYTEALLQAIPVADPRSTKVRQVIAGSVPDPANPPSGCNFHTRCRFTQDVCSKQEPQLLSTAKGSDHQVACHLYGDLELKGFTSRRGGYIGE
jgi:oligopeptide/dipeptide ABC transporter ATP-binding protein